MFIGRHSTSNLLQSVLARLLVRLTPLQLQNNRHATAVDEPIIAEAKHNKFFCQVSCSFYS